MRVHSYCQTDFSRLGQVNPFILTANSKKRRPVPDDMIYNALADYRRLVARGNTVMRITYKDDDEKDAAKREEFRFVLQGMHKFTGKSEFDDDDTTPAVCLRQSISRNSSSLITFC